MAADTSLSDTLAEFTTATETAVQGLPPAEAILPPENGISLFDAKTEIFISYLQGLALRNLNVIRSLKDGSSAEDTQALNDKITNKLIEHRVYLERGVRPLEQKLKYQADRAVKAADDEERASQRKLRKAGGINGQNEAGEADSEGSAEESDQGSDDGEAPASNAGLDSVRPNLAAFGKTGEGGSGLDVRSTERRDGVYRPPRVSATSMPTTETRDRKERRPGRSATLEEYVNTELSHAPLAQPSIGSTIAAGGRTNKDARQLAKEQERRDYEETNLVRLPKESKNERLKQGRRDTSGGFGGEEWRGLGESVDRIGDLTKRAKKDSALDRSRKRRAVEDGPRNDGIGNAFDIKKRRLEKKMRR